MTSYKTRTITYPGPSKPSFRGRIGSGCRRSLPGSTHTQLATNSLMIAAQFPTASHIGGYQFWRTLGRQVRAGERGIRILAPVTCRTTTDDTTEPERLGDDGRHLRQTYEILSAMSHSNVHYLDHLRTVEGSTSCYVDVAGMHRLLGLGVYFYLQLIKRCHGFFGWGKPPWRTLRRESKRRFLGSSLPAQKLHDRPSNGRRVLAAQRFA